MSPGTEDEALIVRYLLDELSADERRPLEQRYFLDDRLFESVCSLEEQLIRDFLRGELSTDQARRFESRYLKSTQLSERVESARLLMRPASDGPDRGEQVSPGSSAPGPRSIYSPPIGERPRKSFRPRAGVLGFAAAGLVTAAMLAAVWFGLDNRRLRTELARSEAERSSLAARIQARTATRGSNPADERNVLPERAESESRLASAARESAKQYGGGMKAAPLAFVLSPGVTRGGDGGRRRLVIPAEGVDRVSLKLDFTPFGHYASYRIIVSSVDGGEVSSRDRPGLGSDLVIDLPAASLPGGDYIIVVKGRLGKAGYEDLESYYFHVVRGLKLR